MGNPDLVVVVNERAVLIKGTEYDQRDEAIRKGLEKFDAYQQDIQKMRVNPETGELWKDADPDWFPEDVTSIHVYDLSI